MLLLLHASYWLWLLNTHYSNYTLMIDDDRLLLLLTSVRWRRPDYRWPIPCYSVDTLLLFLLLMCGGLLTHRGGITFIIDYCWGLSYWRAQYLITLIVYWYCYWYWLMPGTVQWWYYYYNYLVNYIIPYSAIQFLLWKYYCYWDSSITVLIQWRDSIIVIDTLLRYGIVIIIINSWNACNEEEGRRRNDHEIIIIDWYSQWRRMTRSNWRLYN